MPRVTAASPTCRSQDHARSEIPIDLRACERAADIFRALGDTARLKLLSLLAAKELCVSDIAARLGDNLPAVSQRLKVLKYERIVSARREGKHIYYGLADRHVAELIRNALEHAAENLSDR